jgi:transposase InsO family protein
MPWKEPTVSELRRCLVHLVRICHVPVAEACRRFNVSRKTAFKWLARFDLDPHDPLLDRSKTPHRRPLQTPMPQEQLILQARAQFGWGARKIHALLQAQGQSPPSVRTVHQILARHGQLTASSRTPQPPLQRFERPCCHDLWQADHKGPLEVARTRVYPLVILDDHSRYCIALAPCCTDRTMASVWEVFWEAFGEFGLPREVLSDNAFGCTYSPLRSIPSWFDAQLIRLGIAPVHGRAYHPQTQGKVERFNGTLQQEFLNRLSPQALGDASCFLKEAQSFRDCYNQVRPHEALGDLPPVSRLAPSPRSRPATLPEAQSYYPAGSLLRRVGQVGEVRYKGCRILTGRALAGEVVRVEEQEDQVRIFYCWKQIRTLAAQSLAGDKML